MVCRDTRIGSAVTSHATLVSGLAEQQTLSAFHELLREGRYAAAPSAAQQAEFIDAQVSAVTADQRLTASRRASVIRRLGDARAQTMDGRTFYAAGRIMSRSSAGHEALTAYYDTAARETGTSRADVEAAITSDRAAAGRAGRTVHADPTWQREFAARPENINLPMDRQTAFAVERFEQRTAITRAAAPSRPTVTRQPVISRAVQSVGYDPESGRLEVEMHSNPGVGYSYRVPPEVYADMMSGSVGSFYATEIRNNPAYRYDTAQDQTAAGTQTQCATCGQWAGPGHSCPIRESDEERNRTARLARTLSQRARDAHREATAGDNPTVAVPDTTVTAASPTTPLATPATPAAPAAATPARVPAAPPVDREPIRLGFTAQRRYHGDTGSFRTASLTGIQQQARQSGAVNVHVNSTIRQIVAADGTTTLSYGDIGGRVNVAYLGRGRGFAVTAVGEPGDSGTDQLRCTCADYRRDYTCGHVRQLVADVQARLNQDSLRTRHGLTPAQTSEANASVAAELARDRAESVEAQINARTRWGAPEVSYTEDPAAFQQAYRAAKARMAAGEEAVPYMRENATDGLGARDGGRGFGVELEFDIDDGVDRSTALRNIGRDLRAAGLTRSASQSGYHSQMSRGYTDVHQGGWSFEADCTVAGEIVSPIMYDEPETWQNVEKVTEIVRRHGGTISTRAGSHVHVSTGNYNHTVENHNRLMATFRENEDVLYRMSTAPERGSHRGPAWCAPNRVPASGYSDVRQAQYSNNGHGLGINMQSVHGRQSDHVEFRTYDATLNPAQIQMQIKMSLAMAEAAFRDTDHTPTGAEPLGSHRAHNRQEHGASRRLTGDAWNQDTASFRSFADRMFRRTEDKAQATALFAATKWQRTGGRR